LGEKELSGAVGQIEDYASPFLGVLLESGIKWFVRSD
jgi:hypothetical protein